MITARPIIFSTPMVRSTIEGIKTQTRRIVKPQPDLRVTEILLRDDGMWGGFGRACLPDPSPQWNIWRPMPFDVGDLLWCRERIWQASPYPGVLPSGEPDESDRWSSRLVHYAADGEPPNCANRHYGPTGLRNGWFAAPDPYAVWLRRPAIHMPRWASRLTLEITDVRVERLQDISKNDVIAEGITERDGYPIEGVVAGWHEPYAQLWEKLNGKGSWDANPWVWALTFKVHHANVDTVLAQRAEVAA